jgi:hypothetical protein
VTRRYRPCALTRFVAFCLVALSVSLACNESTGPIIGQSYGLSRVNGQPMPFAFPASFGDSSTPLMLMEGWVTFLNASTAERHERLVRTILTSSGDSVPLVSEWTYAGPYRRLPGRLVLTYPTWAPGPTGPLQAADTLLLGAGQLTLRETGFVSPLDTLVRVYCLPSVSC